MTQGIEGEMTAERDGELEIGSMLNGFARAIYEISKVTSCSDFSKYDENELRKTENNMYLHFMKSAAGQVFDEDTGVLNSAHAAWNAIKKLEIELRIAEEAELRKQGDTASANCKLIKTDNNDVIAFSWHHS